MAMKLGFSLLKKRVKENRIKCLQHVNLRVFVIFSSLCQLDPFLIIPHHFAKKKIFRKWMVTFIFSNWRLVSLDYLHVNGMCGKAVTGFLLKFFSR
jgi:hypothetical protein